MIYHAFTNSKHSRGVCVLLSERFKGNIVSSCCDESGRKLLLSIEYDDNIYTIVNLYCPNNQGERSKFLGDCTDWVNSNRIDGSYLILGVTRIVFNGHQIDLLITLVPHQKRQEMLHLNH